ncbi:MAG: efflux RND transporter periplasmic adaptor subunit [Bradyrhizobium sp.]|uniref:efflux RND transporter periplasmic adaptor subunit n=1 Tax=Bradyrhizobium sp. TaxID=376 RepID=UPI003D0D2F85
MSRWTMIAGVGISVLILSGIATYVVMSGTGFDTASSRGATAQGIARYRAGGLEVGITTVPATPRVGDNRLKVELRTPDGEPVPDVEIEAYAEMPAMGAMPAMRAPADLVESAPGRYEGTMDLSMRGEWPLTLTFESPAGEPVRMQFDLATDRANMPIAAGGTPINGAGQPANSADAGGLPRYRAGGLIIGADIEPRIVRVGENRLILEVRDADGNPVSDIDVDAFAQMPAMGAMPAMRAPADLEQVEPGRFEGSLNLSMRGEWPLTIAIDHPEGQQDQRLRFDLATDRQGLTIAAGGVPVGDGPAAVDAANAVTIDNRRRQMIGVETGEATHRNLTKVIRAVGEVTYDERLLSHITLKFDGYIGDLKADYVGATVKEGQVLFTVYSPELLATQQEYLETLKHRQNGGADDPVISAVRQRLRLWDMARSEIDALEQRGVPQDYVPIYAPRTGTLVERNIADGSAARMGQTLLTIADLSKVWVDAKVFEADLELMREGMQASITLPYLPGRTYSATVEYVYPYLQGISRTGRVRLSLDNPEGVLKPDMYAEVALEADLGHRLTVPEEAIIFAGNSRVVFVDLGDGRLNPVRIKTGRRAQGYVEVLEGLSLGDRVVTSGNFLIAAETRLKTGIEQW